MEDTFEQPDNRAGSLKPPDIDVTTPDAASPQLQPTKTEVQSFDIAGLTANSAKKSQKRREMLLKYVLDTGDQRSRLPNRVSYRSDPETMMDGRFVDDLLNEGRGQLGVFVTTEDPGSFEFAPAETLRTEAGELWPQLEKAMRVVDPSRMALVLVGAPVWLTEEDGDGKKVRKPYHLVRLKRQRSAVDRKGVLLDLRIESPPAASPEPAKEGIA